MTFGMRMRWLLMFWHDWRAAVWWAEMQLYPKEKFGDCIISVPYRHNHAEALYEWHAKRFSIHHRVVFGVEMRPPMR